jgi:uncharacterized protein (DUF1684 family)
VNARGDGSNRTAIELKSAQRLAPSGLRRTWAIGALIFLALIASNANAGGDTSDPHLMAPPVVTLAALVRQVTVMEDGSTTQVVIKGDGHLSCRVMHFRNPERVVLDFDGARLVLP